MVANPKNGAGTSEDSFFWMKGVSDVRRVAYHILRLFSLSSKNR